MFELPEDVQELIVAIASLSEADCPLCQQASWYGTGHGCSEVPWARNLADKYHLAYTHDEEAPDA